MSTSKLKLVKTNAEIDFSTYKYYLTCDEIEIDAKNNQMSGVGNLFINSDQLMLKGKKMMADLEKNRLELVKHVEGTFIPSSVN
jgi:lipopolysaccharide assembly outer membrane protein LptD (OstA)